MVAPGEEKEEDIEEGFGHGAEKKVEKERERKKRE